MKYILSLFLLILNVSCYAQNNKKKLMNLLGSMPKAPALLVDTLEKTNIENGWRYKIRYLSEDSSIVFHTPKDYITAYLFVPNHSVDSKIPAMIAIHQDVQ